MAQLGHAAILCFKVEYSNAPAKILRLSSLDASHPHQNMLFRLHMNVGERAKNK
jgi:hypothetical protein